MVKKLLTPRDVGVVAVPAGGRWPARVSRRTVVGSRPSARAADFSEPWSATAMSERSSLTSKLAFPKEAREDSVPH